MPVNIRPTGGVGKLHQGFHGQMMSFHYLFIRVLGEDKTHPENGMRDRTPWLRWNLLVIRSASL